MLQFSSHVRSLSLVFSIVLMEFTAFGMIIPISPYLAKDFGADDLEVGLLMSVYSLTQLIFAPFWGYLSDHLGRKPIILTCLFGSALFYLWFSFANTLEVLFLTRILAGVFGAVMSVSMACIADITGEKNRSRNMGLIGAAIGLGFVIGPFLGGAFGFVGKHWGNNPPLGSSFSALGACLICLMNFLIVLVFLKSKNFVFPKSKETFPSQESQKQLKPKSFSDSPSEEALHLENSKKSPKTSNQSSIFFSNRINIKIPSSISIKNIFLNIKNSHQNRVQQLLLAIKYPVLNQTLFMYFFLALALAGIEASLFLYVRDKLSWSHFPASIGFTYIGLMMLLTQGFLVRKVIPLFGEYKTMIWGLIISGIGFAGVGLTYWLWFLALNVTLLCIGYSLASTCLSGAVSILTNKNQQGSIFGVHQSVFSIARIIGPALGGWSYRDLSPSAPFYISGLLALFALLVGLNLKECFPKHGKKNVKVDS